MAALREILAEFGIEVATDKLEHADNLIEGFKEKIESVAKIVAGAFAIKEVWEFAEGTARAIHEVEASSRALGITTDAVQEFGYAARASGEDAGTIVNMMGRLQVTAANAGKGTGEVGKAFSKLGVRVKDATGQIRPADELFEDVAEGIKNLKNPAERAGMAVQLFGRQGRQLLPFLSRGRAGIAELREEFTKLGGGFDEDAIDKSSAFERGLARVKVAWDGIKGAIVKGLFPPLTWLVNKIADGAGWLVRMSKGTDIVRNGLIAIGLALIPLAYSMAVAFAPLFLAVATVAAIVMAFDDFVGFLEGKKSVIGVIIDKMFGKGSSAEAVKELKDAWTGVKKTFEDLWPTVKQVWEAMKWIVDHAVDIGGILGDKAAQLAAKVDEATGTGRFANMKKGRGGLTFEENAAALEAQRQLNMVNRGGGNKFVPTNRPATVDEATWKKAIADWVTAIQTDTTGRFARFRPETFGAYSGPAGGGAPSGPSIEKMEVHVNANALNTEQAARAVEHGVRGALRNVHRNAKHLLTRAVPADSK